MNIPKARKKQSALQKATASWMETFNPLRHLTLAQAQAIFDAARRGCDARLQWIYQNIEEVDPTLMICAERRASALVDLDWTIRTKQAKRARKFDGTLAQEQANFLSFAFGEAEDKNLFQAIEHLSSAFFRGHAHASPIYSEDGLSLQGFECLNAWNVCRDVPSGQWFWNPTASDTIEMKHLTPLEHQSVIHFVHSRHIDYPAMAIHLRSTLGEKVWGQFLERYGIPPVIVTMPQDIDPNQAEKFAQAAQSIYEGSVGALPAGSQVHYASEARGVNPFKEFLDHQQQLIVLMATGGMLTSLTGATGIGQGATDAHEATWRTIVRRDAALIATALNRTVSDTLLDRAFPGQPHLAQFDFETDAQPSPAEVFDIATKATQAGYRIVMSELTERTGYTLESVQSSALGGGAGVPFLNKKGTDRPLQKDFAALARALQIDLTPAAEAVQAFLADPSRERALWLMRRLPDLLPDDPQAALMLEQTLAETYAQGLESIVQNGECRARDPSKCRTHGNHPGEGQREREKKTPILKDHLGKKFDPKHPEEYTAEDNIRRGKRALKKAITGKPVDVRDAMHKEGLGRIDFLLGWEGKGPALEHGKGMKKLVKKHADELESLPETIEKGRVYKIKSDKTGEFTPYACAIIHGANVAFLSKNDTGWVVTSHYETERTARKIIEYNQ